MRKLLIALLALSACGSPHESQPSELPAALQAKRALYLDLVKSEQGLAGFIDLEACDSVLYSGLLGAAGADVTLTAARDGSGTWTRNPTRDCYTDGGSDSTFSRDMYMGLLWYAAETKNLALVQETYDYCNAHSTNIGLGCVFGKGSILDPKYIISPNLVATTAELLYRLGGEDHPIARNLYTKESSGLSGFQAHLSVLHILLRGKLTGSIPQSSLDRLAEQIDRQPSNALFQLAYHKYHDGDQAAAIEGLSNEAWFPANRLPSSADRCEQYIFQRDFGADWMPCPEENKTHSGTDFLFATKLLLE